MDNWKAKQHQIEFDQSLRDVVNHWLTGKDPNVTETIENITADGRSFKIKFSDYYDGYTFSITLPRTTKSWGGHTFWFTYPDIVKGIGISAWLLEEVVEDQVAQHLSNGKVGKW